METKPLLYGLIGFFIGGIVVSLAASGFLGDNASRNTADVSMTQMTQSLESKYGDDFDSAFITGMIAHHQGAVDMATLAETRAKHEEIKQLSREIISAQNKEIAEMERWRSEWGYSTDKNVDHMMH